MPKYRSTERLFTKFQGKNHNIFFVSIIDVWQETFITNFQRKIRVFTLLSQVSDYEIAVGIRSQETIVSKKR